ncbi:MAG: HD domain-containing protein [candidate division KSB1 bacterium]|nr:HD domain-containing protein [candidate division KSB1 bacterium]
MPTNGTSQSWDSILEHGRFVRFLSLVAQTFGIELLLCDRKGQCLLHVTPKLEVRQEARRPLPLPIDLGTGNGALCRLYLNGWNQPVSEEVATSIGALVRERLLYELENEEEKDSLSDELIDAYQELNLWYNLGDSVSNVTDPDAICEYIAGQVLDLLSCQAVGIYLLDPQTQVIRLHTSLGRTPPPQEVQGLPVWSSAFRSVVTQGQILTITQLASLGGTERELGSEWPVPLLAVPMRARRETVGVLVAAGERRKGDRRSTPELFSSGKRRLLSALGSQAAVLLQNARLYNEFRGLFYSTVGALADAVDAKDPYTHGHSRRVATYAVAIAKRLDLTPPELADLELAGLLHDVGKIGVSEAVLHKPGKLSPREFEHMKEHVVQGAQIVGRVEPMNRLVPLILHHHERYDGNGYPHGLAGDRIPLGARILAVADAFDAMTSSRPYRPAMSVEEAVHEIQTHSGTQFDPEVVEAFLDYVQSTDFVYDRSLYESSFPIVREVRRLPPMLGKYLTGIELSEPWSDRR